MIAEVILGNISVCSISWLQPTSQRLHPHCNVRHLCLNAIVQKKYLRTANTPLPASRKKYINYFEYILIRNTSISPFICFIKNKMLKHNLTAAPAYRLNAILMPICYLLLTLAVFKGYF
jgi:hypothetical protein